MQGEIGTLIQDGKQIGGFLDWNIELKLTSVEKAEGRVYSKAMTKTIAQGFWRLSDASGEEIEALHYQLIGDKLILVNQAKVKVSLSGEVDKLINKPIELVWIT